MKIQAIIVAAGLGKRFGSSDKVLISVEDIPLFIRAIEPFEKLEEINNICLVTRKELFETVNYYLQKFNIKKVKSIIEGGKERQDSVYNALRSLSKDTDIVLIHDAARPLITEDLVKRVLKSLTPSVDGVIPSTSITDTVKWIRSGNIVGGTLNRDVLRMVQTPQVFWFSRVLLAYEKAYEENYYGTDDASLVERYGGQVIVVEGDPKNLKITTPYDLKKMEAFMTSNYFDLRSLRVGIGYDSHPFEEGRKLIIGGVTIPYHKGLKGHSDADVLIHAIIDSLLGCAGLGDIGRHFPDSDSQYRDISSIILLEKTLKILNRANVEPLWIDCIIFAEKPKLSPYIPEMQEKIGSLGININIKAKTNEKMGFIGRQEGIAAKALCLGRILS